MGFSGLPTLKSYYIKSKVFERFFFVPAFDQVHESVLTPRNRSADICDADGGGFQGDRHKHSWSQEETDARC